MLKKPELMFCTQPTDKETASLKHIHTKSENTDVPLDMYWIESIVVRSNSEDTLRDGRQKKHSSSENWH